MKGSDAATGSVGLVLTKSKIFDVRRIRVDLKKLFTKLTEAVARASLATPPGVDPTAQFVVALAGSLDAISLDTPVEDRAWHLVYSAFASAIHQAVDEVAERIPTYSGDIQTIISGLDIRLGQAGVELRPDFFANPGKLPIVRGVQTAFRSWATALGLSAPDALAISRRLPAYFTRALHNQWRSNREFYKPMLEAISSPFASATRLDEDWQRYSTYLARQVQTPLFGEVIDLRSVYVPLRATYIAQATSGAKTTSGSTGARRNMRAVVDLNDYITNWINEVRPSEFVRVVRGGPGSGKSSFLKMLAAELAEDGAHRVLFFPLQRLLLGEQLLAAMSTFLVRTEAFESSPLDPGRLPRDSGRLVLLFDGLDEITKPGEIAEAEARKFLSELRVTLATLNIEECRALAIVTGRTAVVQATRGVLRLPSTGELEILPLFVPRYRSLSFLDPEHRLLEDQRHVWWSKYARAKGIRGSEIPAPLIRRDIEELSSEPLLIYLLVLSRFHKEPQSTDFNRNSVYGRLLVEVLGRRYERDGQAGHIGKGDFAEILEVIATSAWYGDGRTATVDEVRRHCSIRLREVFEQFLQEMGGIHRLIAAFYFQEAEGNALSGKEAFEFTHKSFGEYLTARRIVRAIAGIADGLALGKDFYTIRHAVRDWFALTSPAPITPELMRFIHDELRLPDQVGTLGVWAERLYEMLSIYLDEGVLLEGAAAHDFRKAEGAMRNSEGALIATLSCCAYLSGYGVKPRWSSVHSAGSMLHWLNQQRYAGIMPIGLFLRNWNFDGQNLMCQLLTHLDATGASLRGANLFMADLRSAVMVDCDLTEADLDSCTLDGACFDGAVLCNAGLQGARVNQPEFARSRSHGHTNVLESSDISLIEEASVDDSTLAPDDEIEVDEEITSSGDGVVRKPDGAADYAFEDTSTGILDFRDVFYSASRHPSYETGPSFVRANLQSAQLQRAILVGADFSSANLRGATFRGALLYGASFHDASLDGTDFRGAKMTPQEAEILREMGADVSQIDTSLTLAQMIGRSSRSASTAVRRHGSDPVEPPRASGGS